MKTNPANVRVQCLLVAFLLALLGLHMLTHAAQAQDGPNDLPPSGNGGELGRGGMRQQMRDELRRELREEMQRGMAERRGFRQEGGPLGSGPQMEGPGKPSPQGPGGFLADRLGAGEGVGRGGRLGKYLEIVQSYQSAVQDSYQAVGLAALGLKEYYKRSGQPLDAVKELDEMLKLTSDQKMRNILLFTERQIFEEAHNEAKYIELNKIIIKENLAKTSGTTEKK